MNGHRNESDAGPSMNHGGNVASDAKINGTNQDFFTEVFRALEAVHDPRSSNETRQQAGILLEQAKAAADAPYHGFTLASDRSQAPVVRHYALSILEYVIRHNWDDFSGEQSAAVRGWILHLAQDIVDADPVYVRNKIAQLWVDVAKRSWASDWMDMDELLVRLWGAGLVHKEFVAFVLETLSEDVFNREDAVASMRSLRLSRACVDIFTSESVLREQSASREPLHAVRFGADGWLVRLREFLRDWGRSSGVAHDQALSCALKVLAALKAAMTWSIPKALANAGCVEGLCESLAGSSGAAQMATIEALHALYGRPFFRDGDFVLLVCPMFRTEVVQLLQQVYRSSIVDASDIDQVKYTLAKKLSEMMSNLGNFVESKPDLLTPDANIQDFLKLLMEILSSQSLTISIPVLSSWAKLLRSDKIGGSDAVAHLIGPLLEICSQRLIRYELLPEDSDNATILFLNEDIDTAPDRHAFLGNYRRYCSQVVENIVRRKPFDALFHILNQVDQSLHSLYENKPAFKPERYSKSSMPLLQVDAHFTVVEAALKGYKKWSQEDEARLQRAEQQRASTEQSLQAWCERLLALNFEDPLIRKRVLQLAVAFSTSVLERRTEFMLNVLKNILTTRPVGNPAFPTYNDAVKDLQNDCTHELHRLAFKMPDELLQVYSDLEAKINEIAEKHGLDDRLRLSYYSFLFIISHRATTIDPALREHRLRTFILPIDQSWRDPGLSASLESFEGFCGATGTSRVAQYLVQRRAHEIQDWSTCDLDDEGKAIQAEMTEKIKNLPLRSTKAFLGASVENIKQDSPQYEVATMLWRDVVPTLLPNLLKLLSYAHAFHNPTNWTGLPDEMQSVVSRTLMDRFWQAGISTGSRDEFYARVSGTKMTLEGFASSVRGTIRTIRESCYSIIYCLSKLGAHFYGFADLPQPLAQALFGDAKLLSSHQLSMMMNMVRYLIDDCPTNLREQFLPPVLASLFVELDAKVSGEWESLIRKGQTTSQDDNLTDEMKEESILRQLTYSSVLMVASLLDPQRENAPTQQQQQQQHRHRHDKNGNPGEAGVDPAAAAVTAAGTMGGTDRRASLTTQPGSMRAFVLSSLTILQPLMIFCTHAVQMRDSRSCGIIIRVFRSIVPDFTSSSTTDVAIREHISHEVLQAAITSLHDPYFVDLQKDLAQLIATVYILYSPLSAAPRHVLLSIPGVSSHKLDKTSAALFAIGSNGRQQRALVLDLLEGVRGVSVAEQGRIMPTKLGGGNVVGHGKSGGPEAGTEAAAAATAGASRKGGGGGGKERSEMQARFLKPVDEPGREATPDLTGVSDMFG
ncbi:MAG: hypothetical protein M1825_004211 [Sarcosagium campestre]|nr:MAG: hypothetical protein M1825_004211 [Sarcosagium campestre]